jgi:tRNA A37 methylthiotransferase MiaB
MAHQQAISSARLQLRIGKEIEVLIDEVDEQGAVGRCFFDAPEIDGNVFIDNEQPEAGRQGLVPCDRRRRIRPVG